MSASNTTQTTNQEHANKYKWCLQGMRAWCCEWFEDEERIEYSVLDSFGKGKVVPKDDVPFGALKIFHQKLESAGIDRDGHMSKSAEVKN